MLEKVTKLFRGSKPDSEQNMTSDSVSEVASPKGYYLTSTKTFYSMIAVKSDPSIKKILREAAPGDVLVEFRGKLLKHTDANTLISKLMIQNKSLNEIGDILDSTPAVISNEDATTYSH